MGIVTTALAVSLDGYVAGPHDGPDAPLGDGGEALFDWFTAGEVPSRFYRQFRMSAPSAAFFDECAARCGAVVAGRRTYDISGGWGGDGPLPGVPVVLLTHRPVADRRCAGDIGEAVTAAKELAGEEEVELMGSGPVRAALAAGLLEEISLHLVPVLLGGGVRLLDGVAAPLTLLEVVAAPGVTHLRYRVAR